MTTDQDSINNYLIFRVSPWWDMNNESWRISMIGRSNLKVVNYSNKYPAVNFSSKYLAVNFSSKYPAINRSTTIKCGSSSLGGTPAQPRHQHGSTVGPSLRDKSGLPLQNRCTLRNQQATHHHLRKNIFKPNQQGMASPNEATWHLYPYQVCIFNSEL
jgi:hypothetical protein